MCSAIVDHSIQAEEDGKWLFSQMSERVGSDGDAQDHPSFLAMVVSRFFGSTGFWSTPESPSSA